MALKEDPRNEREKRLPIYAFANANVRATHKRSSTRHRNACTNKTPDRRTRRCRFSISSPAWELPELRLTSLGKRLPFLLPEKICTDTNPKRKISAYLRLFFQLLQMLLFGFQQFLVLFHLLLRFFQMPFDIGLQRFVFGNQRIFSRIGLLALQLSTHLVVLLFQPIQFFLERPTAFVVIGQVDFQLGDLKSTVVSGPSRQAT